MQKNPGLLQIWFAVCCLIVFLSFAPLGFSSETYQCLVKHISDGDTFSCIPERPIPGVKVKKGNSIVVRLYGVDAPEKTQAYGLEAKNTLSALINNKVVTLHVKQIDKYNRVVAIVYQKDINVNLAQIQNGAAWAYKAFLERPYASEFLQQEEIARQSKRGLWADRNPTPPWEYRQHRKIRNTNPED